MRRDQKRQHAFDLYCKTDLTQEQIADMVGVTAKTITSWKQTHKWEELKGAHTVTAQKIINNLYQQAYQLSQEDPTAKTIDQLAKLAKSIEQLSDKRVTVSQTINVFKDFTTYLFRHDPELAKKVNEFQSTYINDMIHAEA